MPLPSPFPRQIDELTAEFMTNALNIEVQAVSSQRIGADRGMLGEIFLLDCATEKGNQRLVAKFAAMREESLASARRGRNHERELRCYEELLADTPVNAPACRGAWYDEETALFLLLQDHVPADESVDQIAGITVAQAELVVREMAAFHAHWWGRSELGDLDWLPTLDGPVRITNLTTLAGIGWQPLTEMLGEETPAVPTGFGESLPSRIEAALRTIGSLPPTLLHCDLRADNLLFDLDAQTVTLIDWQGCGVGPAAFDLAYFLVQSLSVADRRAHEDHLIDLWVSGLQAKGVAVDREQALAGYDASLWYGMAVACALPIISDPDEPRVRSLAAAVTQRTVTSLADAGELLADG